MTMMTVCKMFQNDTSDDNDYSEDDMVADGIKQQFEMLAVYFFEKSQMIRFIQPVAGR